MADRVHPSDSLPAADGRADQARPKAGTYVIQIPKDQIYRVPPPENARLYESYSRRGARRRRSPCCRCLKWTIAALIALAVCAAVAAAVLYLVFQPKLPSFSLDKIAVSPNLTEFDLLIRAHNPNKKIGIYYGEDNDVSVYYSDVRLCGGRGWPAFYQGRRNATVLETRLRGSGVRLSSSLRGELADQQRKGRVPMEIDVRAAVRFKIGAVTTWAMTAKVRCGVAVDKLTTASKIVSDDCRTELDL